MEHEKGFFPLSNLNYLKRCAWCKWWAECKHGSKEVSMEKKTGGYDFRTIAESCKNYILGGKNETILV